MTAGVRRTQGERSASTRQALVDAARPLFAAHGFAAVRTETVVRGAGVTRGALYHHFADKAELFEAVFEKVEAEITGRIDRAVSQSGIEDIVELMTFGAGVWLDVSSEPEAQRIALVDGPAVLGYERWREISLEHGMGLVLSLVEAAVSSGRLPEQPPAPLAHVLLGALDAAAIYVARATDRVQARIDVGLVIDRLIAAQAT